MHRRHYSLDRRDAGSSHRGDLLPSQEEHPRKFNRGPPDKSKVDDADYDDNPALDFKPEYIPRPNKDQKFPPIITIDGRVDTDLDHLMEDALREETKSEKKASGWKTYPKPHIFSVIEGSLDDDIDSIANHDGSMEHKLADPLRSFKDLKIPKDKDKRLNKVSAKDPRRRPPAPLTQGPMSEHRSLSLSPPTSRDLLPSNRSCNKQTYGCLSDDDCDVSDTGSCIIERLDLKQKRPENWSDGHLRPLDKVNDHDSKSKGQKLSPGRVAWTQRPIDLLETDEKGIIGSSIQPKLCHGSTEYLVEHTLDECNTQIMDSPQGENAVDDNLSKWTECQGKESDDCLSQISNEFNGEVLPSSDNDVDLSRKYNEANKTRPTIKNVNADFVAAKPPPNKSKTSNTLKVLGRRQSIYPHSLAPKQIPIQSKYDKNVSIVNPANTHKNTNTRKKPYGCRCPDDESKLCEICEIFLEYSSICDSPSKDDLSPNHDREDHKKYQAAENISPFEEGTHDVTSLCIDTVDLHSTNNNKQFQEGSLPFSVGGSLPLFSEYRRIMRDKELAANSNTDEGGAKITLKKTASSQSPSIRNEKQQNTITCDKDLIKQLEQVTRDPQACNIRSSLRAAINVAEHSMSAAAKVAQALFLVIEATKASDCMQRSSSESRPLSRRKTVPAPASPRTPTNSLSTSSVHDKETHWSRRELEKALRFLGTEYPELANVYRENLKFMKRSDKRSQQEQPQHMRQQQKQQQQQLLQYPRHKLRSHPEEQQHFRMNENLALSPITRRFDRGLTPRRPRGDQHPLQMIEERLRRNPSLEDHERFYYVSPQRSRRKWDDMEYSNREEPASEPLRRSDRQGGRCVKAHRRDQVHSFSERYPPRKRVDPPRGTPVDLSSENLFEKCSAWVDRSFSPRRRPDEGRTHSSSRRHIGYEKAYKENYGRKRTSDRCERNFRKRSDKYFQRNDKCDNLIFDRHQQNDTTHPSNYYSRSPIKEYDSETRYREIYDKTSTDLTSTDSNIKSKELDCSIVHYSNKKQENYKSGLEKQRDKIEINTSKASTLDDWSGSPVDIIARGTPVDPIFRGSPVDPIMRGPVDPIMRGPVDSKRKNKRLKKRTYSPIKNDFACKTKNNGYVRMPSIDEEFNDNAKVDALLVKYDCSPLSDINSDACCTLTKEDKQHQDQMKIMCNKTLQDSSTNTSPGKCFCGRAVFTDGLRCDPQSYSNNRNMDAHFGNPLDISIHDSRGCNIHSTEKLLHTLLSAGKPTSSFSFPLVSSNKDLLNTFTYSHSAGKGYKEHTNLNIKIKDPIHDTVSEQNLSGTREERKVIADCSDKDSAEKIRTSPFLHKHNGKVNLKNKEDENTCHSNDQVNAYTDTISTKAVNSINAGYVGKGEIEAHSRNICYNSDERSLNFTSDSNAEVNDDRSSSPHTHDTIESTKLEITSKTKKIEAPLHECPQIVRQREPRIPRKSTYRCGFNSSDLDTWSHGR